MMRIVHNTLGVFWTRPGWPICCHADLHLLPGEATAEAVARFRRTFPDDVVVGVKDHSGRWVA